MITITVRKLVMTALSVGGAALATSATAQQCDCARVVGSCTASYQLTNIKNDPQRINSAAELLIKSSQPMCSKVTYYVDATPYISVLARGNSTTESLFGTAEFNSKTVSIESCKVCATGQDKAEKAARQASQPGTATALAMFDQALESEQAFDPAEYENRFGEYQAQGHASDQAFNAFIGIMSGAAAAVSASSSAPSSNQASPAGEIYVPKIGTPDNPYAPANTEPLPMSR